MLWLKILIGLAVLFLLLCRVRLGIRVDIAEIVSADVVIGFLRFRVVPTKDGAKIVAKPKKTKKRKKPKDLTKTVKKIPVPTVEDLKSAYHIFQGPMRKILRRIGQGICIHPLSLSATIPGQEDPAAAAETYGRVCAAMWTVMPLLEELIDIPKPSLHVGVDYDLEHVYIRGHVGISIRVGTLLSIGFGALIPGVRWLIKFYRAHKNDKPRQEKTAETEAPKSAA
ncbi:hypothetical protein [Oscillibacter sp.]|uniref:hypothetical protein n=1 Tax=Oscillibacter sp. TaxID=1945593 RepID=UPI0028AE1391|nr:hypothetical protein [Oscillibacter sp.]